MDAEVSNPTPWVLLVLVVAIGICFLVRRRRAGIRHMGVNSTVIKALNWLGLRSPRTDLKSRAVDALVASFEELYEGAAISCADHVHVQCEGEQYFQFEQQFDHFSTLVQAEVDECGIARERRSGKPWPGCPDLYFHLHKGPLAVFVTRDPDAVPNFDEPIRADVEVPKHRKSSSTLEHSALSTSRGETVTAASVPHTDPVTAVPPTQGTAPRYSLVLSVDDKDVRSIDVPNSSIPVEFKVGRAPDSELLVPAESSRVSRLHLDMTFAEKGIYVADRSSWGTWHCVAGNWQRLEHGKPTFVAVDEPLALTGDLSIQVRVRDSAASGRR